MVGSRALEKGTNRLMDSEEEGAPKQCIEFGGARVLAYVQSLKFVVYGRMLAEISRCRGVGNGSRTGVGFQFGSAGLIKSL